MKHYFNTNKVLSVTALAISAITVFFACKKDDKMGADENRDKLTISAAEKETQINAIYEDAFTETIDVNSTENGLNGQTRQSAATEGLSRCAGVIIGFQPADLITFPKTITIDYGAGCTDNRGRSRKGKIIVVVDKMFWQTGATAEITFENYFINNIRVEGKQTVTNLSSNGGFGYTYAIEGGKLTYPDGSMINYSGTRTLQQKEGGNTMSILDDTYELTGHAKLEDSTSSANVLIKSPLHKKIACQWIDKGELAVTVNAHTASIQYGEGTCDNKALLTLGDKTKEITLQP
ncbi:hypothetical protein ACFOTA_09940 [Chitinophaga sp. GCM10012297]|uniref:Lipoprotein n=1 Tax=Chitinophaga chungangae TaxID=2821488 RepID=A0ABS3YCV7_9BACT|nr:hypothetical protein [Chitinophaga chungangae]MBO9152526.1 hypothetical protein [Chitinophaga chungangae]